MIPTIASDTFSVVFWDHRDGDLDPKQVEVTRGVSLDDARFAAEVWSLQGPRFAAIIHSTQSHSNMEERWGHWGRAPLPGSEWGVRYADSWRETWCNGTVRYSGWFGKTPIRALPAGGFVSVG